MPASVHELRQHLLQRLASSVLVFGNVLVSNPDASDVQENGDWNFLLIPDSGSEIDCHSGTIDLIAGQVDE